MPPQRTFPSMKPLKTERTHEENQERAYIAASRRSDRSLEARVESARRASEIHKRRTGRSLRVTEQDVINEEMYEEEDDDIPSQYHRLTAHLQTGSAEFNRRLQNYLANHVAMRTALNDAIHNNFSQHYPNAPQFAHNNGMFPSPLVTQGFPSSEPVRSPPAVSPHTPHAYRSAPYPMPGQAGFRGQSQQQQQQGQIPPRNYPIMSPQARRPSPTTPGSGISPASRRMSMPVVRAERPEFQQLPKAASPLSDSADVTELRNEDDLLEASVNTEDVSDPGTPKTQAQLQKTRPGSIPNFPHQTSFGPFSMALPMESQQMVNRAALPQNDFGAALMGGNENWMFESTGLGASNPGEMLKADSNFYPNTAGMNTTLLPEYPTGAAVSMASDRVDLNALASMPSFDFGQFLDMSGSNSSNAPSGAGTPAADAQVWKDLVEPGWVDESNPN